MKTDKIKKNLLIVAVVLIGLLSLSLVISSENDLIVESENDLNYATDQDGSFVLRDTENNAYRFGLTIVGTTNLNNLESGYVYHSDVSDWSWSEDSYSENNKTFYTFTGETSGELDIEQKWIYDSKLNRAKTNYSITNNLGYKLLNIEYWFVVGLEENLMFVDRNPEFRIGSLTYNFQDIIDSNLSIEDVIFGDGSSIGRSGENVFALKVNLGDLQNGETKIIDPLVTSLLSPTIATSISGNWSNPSNILTSNNVYTEANLSGQYMFASNFSFLSNEGGDILDDSIIEDIIINVEGKKTPGGPGTTVVNVSLSFDGGNTFYDSDDSTQCYWQAYLTATEGTSTVAESFLACLLHGKRISTSQINNSNFIIRLVYDSGQTAQVDNLQTKIYYNDPAVLNVTYSDLDSNTAVDKGQAVYHLAIPQNTHFNSNNSAFYLPFDYNDSVYSLTGYDVPELSQWDGIHRMTNDLSGANRSLVWKNDSSCKIGGCIMFNSSRKDRILINTAYNSYAVNYTVSFWANKTGIARGTFIDGSPSSSMTLVTGLVSGDLDFVTTNVSGVTQTCSAEGAFASGNLSIWRHVAIVNRDNNKSVYIDGELKANCLHNNQRANYISYIGCNGAGAISLCLTGTMDEIIMYDSSLNSSDVSQIYQNTSTRFYSKGERILTNYNISGNNTINLTIDAVQPFGSMINVSVGAQSGGTYVYGSEYSLSGNSVNGLAISTPTNFSLKFIFYSSPNQFITPIMNDSFSISSYYSDNCMYVGGNWNVDRTNNCVIGSNVAGDTGTNMTVSGTGSFTVSANITGFWDYIFKKDCSTGCEDYATLGNSLG